MLVGLALKITDLDISDIYFVNRTENFKFLLLLRHPETCEK